MPSSPGIPKKENSTRFGLANFERRRQPRFTINLPVDYVKLERNRVIPAQAGDISEGGLLLHISEDLQMGQDLKIVLFIDPGSGLKSIEAEGRVVWKDCQLLDDGSHRVGINFLYINPESQETLRAFLNRLLEMKLTED